MDKKIIESFLKGEQSKGPKIVDCPPKPLLNVKMDVKFDNECKLDNEFEDETFSVKKNHIKKNN